jgi:hypothetical protein
MIKYGRKLGICVGDKLLAVSFEQHPDGEGGGNGGNYAYDPANNGICTHRQRFVDDDSFSVEGKRIFSVFSFL